MNATAVRTVARQRLCFLGPIIVAVAALPVQAVVVVISNKTPQRVEYVLSYETKSQQEQALEAFDLTAVPVRGPLRLSFESDGERRDYQLLPNSVYFFSLGSRGLEFGEIDLGARRDAVGPVEADSQTGDPAQKQNADAGANAKGSLRIAVKVLVDEEEPAARKAWEARLRRRVEAASKIIERHCRVRFEVVAFETWQSDNATTDFPQSLREFEREVMLAPARLVLGFTSQYEFKGSHLGGTRAPLHSHILIRERHRKYSEPERLEVLVHELGHFLGAAHSPEPDSVMRPMLADNKSVARRFRIQFDPLNTLAINLLAEGLQEPDTWGLAKLPSDAREHLARVYTEIDRAFLKDPVAKKYREILSQPGLAVRAKIVLPTSILASARRVRLAVVEAARRNHRRALPGAGPAQGPFRVAGDELTEYYVRAAAEVASELPAEQAAAALPVGLALALDRSRDDGSLLGRMGAIFESPEQRQRRLEVIGTPTMWQRGDLAQHFVVSAALASLLGAKVALQVGLAKELSDSAGGSGFSFADLSADLAGIAFAERLTALQASGASPLNGFEVKDYFPDPSRLPEGMTPHEFQSRFGSVTDVRFRELLTEIQDRIGHLPPYQKKSAGARSSASKS